MANHKIFLFLPIILVTFQLVSSVSDSLPYPISPSIVLYNGKNQTGKSLSVKAMYVSDLSHKNFGNQAQSACVNGTWLLYDNPNYNLEGGGVMEYVSGEAYCTNLHTIGQQSSSLRFVGSVLDAASDSITFYSQTYFQGLEEYFAESASYFETLKNGSHSLIVTGTSGWRLFEQSHFRGESICISEKGISGISAQPPILMIPNISEQYNHFLQGSVASVRQEDCF